VHIAIDAHSVGAGLGGNETYATNLIEALAAVDQVNQYTLYVTRPAAVRRFSNRWPNFNVKHTLPHTPLVRIPITLSRELRRHPVDLLHVQYTAPPFAPCPIVTTVHDLAFEHLPETFNRRSWMQLRLTVRRSTRRAAHIITLSEYSRRDISKTYGIAPKRITVTPAAAPPHIVPVAKGPERQEILRTHGIEGDYFLSLCSIQPRKNLVRLIRAYASLRSSRPQHRVPQLVLAGKRGWLDSETMRVAAASPFNQDILFTGYVQDADLSALYSGAVCFVYPSYFEGFGLPVLEAMQCGVPVIAGDQTSLPEIVQDAGALVDPFDEQALAICMARMIDDAQYRTDLAARGLRQAKKFSWMETARLTLQVYDSVAKPSKSRGRRPQ
jgi:glycosyltransferase involved in cell wall biosynthesis